MRWRDLVCPRFVTVQGKLVGVHVTCVCVVETMLCMMGENPCVVGCTVV